MNLKQLFVWTALLVPLASYAEGFSGAYVGGYLGYVEAEDDAKGDDV